MGIIPQVGVKIKKYLKPPTRFSVWTPKIGYLYGPGPNIDPHMESHGKNGRLGLDFRLIF